jgi:glutathione S-transferase
LGKVPYLKTPEGAVCESAVMLEYIEQKYPQNPLIPADPFAAAKVRELALFLDLHLELVARNLYPEAFFGGKVSDSVKEKTAAQLEKSVAAFAKLAKFSPFIAGDSLSVGRLCRRDAPALGVWRHQGDLRQRLLGRTACARLPQDDGRASPHADGQRGPQSQYGIDDVTHESQKLSLCA